MACSRNEAIPETAAQTFQKGKQNLRTVEYEISAGPG